MTTFDHILPRVAEVLRGYADALPTLGSILVNRDLNGRVRLVVGEPARTHATAKQALDAIARELQGQLGLHAYPAENAVLFEAELDIVCAGVPSFPLEGLDGVQVIDRLATEDNWASIAPESTGAPRIVFFSQCRVMSPLSGLTVPCDYSAIFEHWQQTFPNGPRAASMERLPPQHAERGWDGIKEDLIRLGVFNVKADGRIDMPGLYRVGFGLGRRGGVKPKG